MARIVRMVTGFALVAAGIPLLVLPGPGILTIVAGLALLSKDLHWARRLKEWVTSRFVDQPKEEPDRV